MNLCGKSPGFADFENTVDRGSAVIFDADFGLCLLNEIWITNPSSALIGMWMSSSKLFLSSKEVHLNSGVRLLLELYCVVVIKHVAFFTIWAKLTEAFTCTSLPLNLYTSVFGCGCGFGFKQKFWRIDGFGEKKAQIGGMAYPYSPLPSRNHSRCLVTRVEINPWGKRYWSSRPYSAICWTGSFSWYLPFSSFSCNKCWLNLEDK